MLCPQGLQGYLADNETPPPRTLQKTYLWPYGGPMGKEGAVYYARVERDFMSTLHVYILPCACPHGFREALWPPISELRVQGYLDHEEKATPPGTP